MRPKIELDDYEYMVARCIEYKLDEYSKPDDWHHLSLKILLALHGPHEGAILQLLPGKYRIDPDLYNKAKLVGIRDLYYEEIGPEHYSLPSPEQKDNNNQYGGYRSAYHLIRYGGERRTELISWWNRYGYHSCTYDAACDYYKTKDKSSVLKMLQSDDK